MAAPQTPQGDSTGTPTPRRRPRARLARRSAAVLSIVAALGLGGVMYLNDHQPGATLTSAAANSGTSPGSSSGTSSDTRAYRPDDREHEGSGDDNGDDGSLVDRITSLIEDLSGDSSASNPRASNSSNANPSGTSQTRSVPTPHSSTRGS